MYVFMVSGPWRLICGILEDAQRCFDGMKTVRVCSIGRSKSSSTGSRRVMIGAECRRTEDRLEVEILVIDRSDL